MVHAHGPVHWSYHPKRISEHILMTHTGPFFQSTILQFYVKVRSWARVYEKGKKKMPLPPLIGGLYRIRQASDLVGGG